jgi:hypothetical protein
MSTPRSDNREPVRPDGLPPAASDPNPPAAPVVLTPADEVIILVGSRIPRRWLRVAFALAAGADPAQVALGTAWFVTRVRAADKRLRLTVDQKKCCAAPGEIVLVFAPHQGGSLAAGWLEDVKPIVSALAAEFDGAELRAVEVVSEASEQEEKAPAAARR